MRLYKKLEDAVNMLLADNRDLDFNGYSKICKGKYNEDGKLEKDNDLRLNYDGEVVRIFIDSIFVFGVNNGWVFSYPTFFDRNKNMKKYVKDEINKIVDGYKKQLLLDKQHIKNRFK